MTRVPSALGALGRAGGGCRQDRGTSANGLPRGGITGQGQSERLKPDPRRSVHGVESSNRPAGVDARPVGPKAAARLRPARPFRAWGQPERRLGLVVLCPDNSPHRPA